MKLQRLFNDLFQEKRLLGRDYFRENVFTNFSKREMNWKMFIIARTVIEYGIPSKNPYRFMGTIKMPVGNKLRHKL